MPKQSGDLRVLFWNVQDMGKRGDAAYEEERLRNIMQIIQDEDADVSCIAEVMDPRMKTWMAEILPPGYTITETFGNDMHHLITIFKNSAEHSVLTLQKDDFKNEKGQGRSFPYIEVSTEDKSIAILPMHAKSGARPADYYIRKNTMQKIADLASALEAEDVPLMVLGDLNTMGNSAHVDGEEEIRKLRYMLYDPTEDPNYEGWKAGHLTMLEKDHPFTWKGIGRDSQYDDSNFDHVFLSDPYEDVPDDQRPVVQVKGWPECATEDEKQQWIRDYSDHAYVVVDIKDFHPAP